MRATPDPVARGISILYPQLTRRACAHLAREVTKLIRQGLEQNWNLEEMTLSARGKRSSPFRAKLVELRGKRNLTQGEVAQKADWSLSKMLRIEGGEVGVSQVDMAFLIRLYEVTDPRLAAWLYEEARKSRQRRPTS